MGIGHRLYQMKLYVTHVCMAAADSVVVLFELDDQWD